MLSRKQQPQIKRRPRLVPRGDGLEIVRIGQRHIWFSDLYVRLLAMSWGPLLLVIGMLYFFSNVIFADLYHSFGTIENAKNQDFADMFFFSVQTMATIGYGKLVPVGFATNAIVSFEALWGFAFFAFVMGLAFAKFSRPTARVIFTEMAVISDFEGKPHLKIRLANERANRIVDAKVSLVLLRNVTTKEGMKMRQFQDLKLVRDHVPLLQLTWMLMHPIDADSPLFGATDESLRMYDDEVIVSLSGMDETISQTIYTRHSYVADEIMCGANFEDVLTRTDDGRVEVNYNKFHLYQKIH